MDNNNSELSNEEMQKRIAENVQRENDLCLKEINTILIKYNRQIQTVQVLINGISQGMQIQIIPKIILPNINYGINETNKKL